MERDLRMQCLPSRNQLPALQEPQLLYLLVEITPTAGSDSRARLPLDICLLLDNSSSMRGDRLYQAKEAARYIVNELSPDDYFALITFNDHPSVTVPRQSVQATAAIREHISEVQPSGGTEIARAMEAALEQMARGSTFSGVRRVILLTDGQTYGDESRCVELARRLQEQGIGITTLGIGEEWNEDLLATMAAHGNSRSAYIAGPQSIVPLFREEMRLLQGIVAQEMSLSFQPAAQVAIQHFFRISPEIAPLSLRESWEHDLVAPLGEWMGSEAQVFLAEIVLPPVPAGEHRFLQATFFYRLPQEHYRRQQRYELRLPCIAGLESTADVPDKVRRGLEKVTAYRLQESAWQDARRGNIEQATRRLQAAATRLVQMGEERLAQTVQEEARRLERTGQTSSVGKKEIHYGTRGLGRRWSDRPSE